MRGKEKKKPCRQEIYVVKVSNAVKPSGRTVRGKALASKEKELNAGDANDPYLMLEASKGRLSCKKDTKVSLVELDWRRDLNKCQMLRVTGWIGRS